VAAQLPPKLAGVGVARGGKEEGVAWGTQIFLEQIESERPSRWLDEKATGTQAEKTLVPGQESGRKREGESPNDSPAIAKAIPEWRAFGCDRIIKQQPPETPFNAQSIFTTALLLNRRSCGLTASPRVEEACHIG